MPALFGGIRAPSTLGSFLRSFTWGNVLQLQKVHRQFLAELAGRVAAAARQRTCWRSWTSTRTQKRVYGHAKQGAAFGPHEDPGQKPAGPRAERAGRDDLHAAGGTGDRRHQAARRQRRLRPRRRLDDHRGGRPPPAPPGAPARWWCGSDSAFYGSAAVQARPPRRSVLLGHRAHRPQGPRRDRRHPATTPGHRSAIPAPSGMTSCAAGSPTPQVAEVQYTAFTSKKGQADHRPADRPPGQRPQPKAAAGQGELFTAWRYHAVFTDSPVRDAPGRRTPPRPRPGRAGLRRLDRRPAGAPAVGLVPRQRRLAGAAPPSAATCCAPPAPWPASPTPKPGAPPCAAISSLSPPAPPGTATATSPCTCPKTGTARPNG